MVEFKTILDENATKILNKSHSKRQWLIIMAADLLILFGGIANIASAEDDAMFGVFLTAFGAVFPPLLVLINFITRHSLNKSNYMVSGDTESYYRFDAQRIFERTVKGVDYQLTAEYTYRILYRVVETREAYLMYVSKIQAHIIKKSDLIGGTLEELDGYFRYNLADKFKPLNK